MTCKWFGRWDATPLLWCIYRFRVNTAFLHTKISWRRKNVEVHASHVILHFITPHYKTIFIVEQWNHIHGFMLEFIFFLSFKPLLSYDLVPTHFNLRGEVCTQIMRLVHYLYFSQNKFRKLSVILWDNALP